MLDRAIHDTEVKTLNEYVDAIKKIRMKYLYGIDMSKEILSEEEYVATLREPSSKKLYFRGQKNKEWLIMPNVFRESGLSCEAAMIHKAYLCNPEILQHRTPFERLAVLQHYELGTRLLDITSNPLVALFFACQPCTVYEKITSKSNLIKELLGKGFAEEQITMLLDSFTENSIRALSEKNGVVYFKCAQSENFNKIEIQILAHLAEVDMKEYSIKSLVDSLLKNDIVKPLESERLSKNHYKEMLNVLESTYFVESSFSNERLIRQDGSFLISGHINTKIKNGDEIILEKATGSLLEEFENERIIISAEYKETILKELDTYNINELSLFPEIDHKLKYIQRKCREVSHPVAPFEKRQKDIDVKDQQPEESSTLSSAVAGDAIIVADFEQNYLDIIKSLLTIDWEKSDSIKANIKVRLKKYLVGTIKQSKADANINSNIIFDHIYKKYSGKIYNHSSDTIE